MCPKKSVRTKEREKDGDRAKGGEGSCHPNHTDGKIHPILFVCVCLFLPPSPSDGSDDNNRDHSSSRTLSLRRSRSSSALQLVTFTPRKKHQLSRFDINLDTKTTNTNNRNVYTIWSSPLKVTEVKDRRERTTPCHEDAIIDRLQNWNLRRLY